MKTATVVGYHGRANLGDDMFLRLTAEWLSRAGVERLFVTGFPDRLPSFIAGVHIVPYEKRWRISRLVWFYTLIHAVQSSVVVFSAGSIFTVQPFFLAYVVVSIARALRRDLRTVGLGVSIGPLASAFDRYWCGRLLDQFDEIVARDEASVRLLKELHVHRRPIVASDLALLYEPVFDSPKGKRDVVAVDLTARAERVAGRQGIRTSEVITAALKAFARERASTEVRIIVCCTDAQDGDTAVALPVLRDLLAAGIDARLSEYDGRNPESFLKTFADCAAVIACRMHSGVFATMYGVPVLQVAYADKIRELYANCSLDDLNLIALGDLTVQCVTDFLYDAFAGRLRGVAIERQRNMVAKRKVLRDVLAQI